MCIDLYIYVLCVIATYNCDACLQGYGPGNNKNPNISCDKYPKLRTLTKTESGERGMFERIIDKISFL